MRWMYCSGEGGRGVSCASPSPPMDSPTPGLLPAENVGWDFIYFAPFRDGPGQKNLIHYVDPSSQMGGLTEYGLNFCRIGSLVLPSCPLRYSL